MKQYHILISGLVQGVGYRNFSRRQALNLGLSGWVRNLTNGQVEIMAAGPAEKLGIFLDKLRQGPPMAKVEKLVITEIKPPDLDSSVGFKRRPTV